MGYSTIVFSSRLQEECVKLNSCLSRALLSNSGQSHRLRPPAAQCLYLPLSLEALKLLDSSPLLQSEHVPPYPFREITPKEQELQKSGTQSISETEEELSYLDKGLV